MKKVFKSFLAIAIIGAVTTVTSCTKTCDPGYEGDDCKTEIRAKFIGQYAGPETCTVGTDNYTITVGRSSTDALKITFANVYNQAYTAVATVDGSSFTVETQNVATDVTVAGTGTLSGNTLTFTYTIVTVGAASNTCTFVGTKL
jgi:hypothetical protein